MITGGASGIGLACAQLMHARGARVAVVDKDEAALARIAEGERLMTVNADNRSVPSIAAGCAAVLAREPCIDIVVNCAGISGFSRPIAAIDEDDFDAMFATHVKGAFFWVRQALPHMPDGGRIINVASDFSMTGFAAMSHYVAAKSALLGLTKAWAREFAPRAITVNAVAPGLIATPMTRGSIGDAVLAERGARVPLGRLARAEEIAFAVAWLASREAAMMTGQTVSPNGGNAIVGF